MTDSTDTIHALYELYKYFIRKQGLEKVLWIRKYKHVVKIGVRKQANQAGVKE